MARFSALATLALSLLFLQGCDNDSDAPPPTVYEAEIVWTEFGIPHITAEDWGSLGYGYGFAFARENFCVVMKEYLFANGESARWLGEEEGDLNSDFVYQLYNSEEAIDRIVESLSERVIELGEGYVSGLNRHLRDTGVDNLAAGEEGCRDEAWVREMDFRGMVALWHKRILLASADPLVDFMVGAAPSQTVTAASLDQVQQLLAQLDPASIAAGFELPEPAQIGSNAYAIGAESSDNSSGILFGNPHFPWQGTNRFFVSQLTIPGVYNASGGSLYGIPGILIGFTQNVAWSHTVSTGQRFTFYEMVLNPDNPLEYEYDGAMVAMEPVTVTADVLNESGQVSTQEHTFYMTRYGPMVDLSSVSELLAGWPNVLGTAFAYRDANLENLRGFEQWLSMAQAADMGEFTEALRDIGIPWVNTIAADRFGDAFYGDISTIPHVTQAQFDSCVRGLAAPQLTAAGFTTLDGSDPDCEWGNDPDTAPGVFGYDSLPKLPTRNYGANANDSYWLSNPDQLLTGFSPIIGGEEIEQSMRTRLTFVQAEERLGGDDGLGEPGFSKETVKQMSYGARNQPAELILADVVSLCSAVTDWSVFTENTAQAAQACSVLGDWNLRHTVDTVGGHIFFEFWNRIRNQEDLWVVPFDATDPVGTPNTLNPAVSNEVLTALAGGVDALVDAGIAMDIPWGEVQFDEKNGVRYPIHGASTRMAFSVITSDLVAGQGYSNITHGNSYMQTVTWDASDCPDVDGMITYSQSTDPASPHYADATELYSLGGWIDMAFCEADVEAAEIRRMTLSGLAD